MSFTLEQLTLLGMIAGIIFHAVCFIMYIARQNFRLESLEEWKKKHDPALSDFGALQAKIDNVIIVIADLCRDMKDWKTESSRVYERIFEKIDAKVDKE